MHIIRRLLLSAAMLTMLHLIAGRALAQRATASVSGSVTDASQSAVPGAKVLIRNISTGIERLVTSNELGYYVVTAP